MLWGIPIPTDKHTHTQHILQREHLLPKASVIRSAVHGFAASANFQSQGYGQFSRDVEATFKHRK